LGPILAWILSSGNEATLPAGADRQATQRAVHDVAALTKSAREEGRAVPSPSGRQAEPAASAPLTAVMASTDCVITGRCLDAGGRVLPGVRIELLGVRWTLDGGIPRIDPPVSGVSDASGRFDLHFTPAKGHVDSSILSAGIEARSKGFSASLLEVKPTAPRRFDAGDVVLERGVALAGVVHDTAGSPEEGATIELWQHDVSSALQKHADQGSTAHD
jgi:protocatechuate 3,4-dioxygenase beta subunit